MTDMSRAAGSARALILFLALGLVVMLAASLKERFEHPHLAAHVETRAPQTAGDDSVGSLMRQVAENPNDVTAIVHLVEHLISDQSWDAAETFAQRAVTLDVSNPRPLYLLGVVMHSQGRHKDAAEALEKVLALKDEASVRYSLGVLYLYFLEDPARGVAHLSAGLNDPAAGEDLKKALREELEKAPLPAEAAKTPEPAKAPARAPKK